jgi:protein SCO1/2
MTNKPYPSRFVSALLALLAATAIGLVGCTEKPSFSAIDITGAAYGNDFAAEGTMFDQFGKPRSIADFKGKIVVLFFGYTQCPDVCPTTMAELSEAIQLLGKDGDKVQGLFVTVDPERDTVEILKPYMSNFHPGFLALRTSPEKLAVVAKDFKTFYAKVPGKTPGSYAMDHSAGSYVFDTTGKIRLYTRYGSGAAALAADIGLLLKESS